MGLTPKDLALLPSGSASWTHCKLLPPYLCMYGLLCQESFSVHLGILKAHTFFKVRLPLAAFPDSSQPTSSCPENSYSNFLVSLLGTYHSHPELWGFASLRSKVPTASLTLFFKKDFIYLSLERGGGREKERKRNTNVWLPPTRPPTGDLAHAPTGNRTGDPSVLGLALNPLSQAHFFPSYLQAIPKSRGPNPNGPPTILCDTSTNC